MNINGQCHENFVFKSRPCFYLRNRSIDNTYAKTDSSRGCTTTVSSQRALLAGLASSYIHTGGSFSLDLHRLNLSQAVAKGAGQSSWYAVNAHASLAAPGFRAFSLRAAMGRACLQPPAWNPGESARMRVHSGDNGSAAPLPLRE